MDCDITSGSPLRSTFKAWAKLTQLRRERFRDLVLAEGQRRYFALRRSVFVWLRWAPSHAVQRKAAAIIASSLRRSRLGEALRGLRSANQRRRILRRALSLSSRGVLRSSLRTWHVLTQRHEGLLALNGVFRRCRQRWALGLWASQSSKRAALNALTLALERIERVVLLAKGMRAFVETTKRAAVNQLLRRATATLTALHSPLRRCVYAWRALVRTRARLLATSSAVTVACDKIAVSHAWRAWRAAELHVKRGRANEYIAGAHYTSVLTRKAFTAFRYGVRLAIDERPMLAVCKRILEAWSVYALQKRHAHMGAIVAKQRVARSRCWATLYHWRGVARKLRAHRNSVVVAMRHWRRSLISQTFAGWVLYRQRRLEAATEREEADVHYNRVLAVRVLRKWAACHFAIVSHHRAAAFSRARLLQLVFPAWRNWSACSVARKTNLEHSLSEFIALRRRSALRRWLERAAMLARLRVAATFISHAGRRRTLRRIWTAWRCRAIQAAQLRACTAVFQERRAAVDVRRAIAAWRRHTTVASGLEAAGDAATAAGARRLRLRALRNWLQWSSSRTRARRSMIAVIVGFTSRRLSYALRCCIRKWRDFSALSRAVFALQTRARCRLTRHRASAVFGALASYAAWRKRRRAAYAAADYGNDVRLVSTAWASWRKAHAATLLRCARQHRALSQWSRGLMRRCFTAWKTWQQHRAALARQWVDGSSLRSSFPQAGASHRPPPRGISSEVAGHLGRLELVAATVPDSGRRDSPDASVDVDARLESEPDSTFVPLLLLINATQRLFRDTAAAARCESPQLATTDRRIEVVPTAMTVSHDSHSQPFHTHAQLAHAPTRTKRGDALTSLTTVGGNTISTRPRPRVLQPDSPDSCDVGERTVTALPSRCTPVYPGSDLTNVRMASASSQALVSFQTRPDSTSDASLRVARNPSAAPAVQQPARDSCVPKATSQLHDVEFWSSVAEEVQSRGETLDRLTSRISVLHELLLTRQTRSASLDSNYATENEIAVRDLQTVIQELTLTRERISLEQEEWLKALALARPRLAAARVIGSRTAL